MNEMHLQQLLDSYAEKMDSGSNPEHRETYKWSAVSYFQKYWDVDADNFGEMFKAAFEESINHIDVPSFQPLAGVKYLCRRGEENMERVRRAFKALLGADSSHPEKLQSAVEGFVAEMNRHLQEVAPDKWKYHQEISSALLYRSCADPDNNYMFGESEVKAFTGFLGVRDEVFPPGSDTPDLAAYYRLCDAVAAELLLHPHLLQMVAEVLETEADNADDSSVTEVDGENHILVYDLIHCAKAYHLYDELSDNMPETMTERSVEGGDPDSLRIAQQLGELQTGKEKLQAQRDALDYPELDGTELTHKKYGKGKVSSQSGRYLTVEFEKHGERKFLLPEALTKGFLSGAPENALERCSAIAALDEDILAAQREIELLLVQQNRVE